MKSVFRFRATNLFIGSYDRMVCDSITGYLEDLKLYECVAISIKKNNDNYWADDEQLEWAVYYEGLAQYIAKNYVYESAGGWSNQRISTYLDSFCEYESIHYNPYNP